MIGWWTRTAPRVLGSLWIPVVTIPVVIAMGVLQFRWLGQLSEQDRERRQAHLTADAQRFGKDFDRELARAYLAFQMDLDGISRRDVSDAVARYQRWRTQAPYPGLVRDVWLAVPEPAGVATQNARSVSLHLLRFDAENSRFVDERAPTALEHLRRSLEARQLGSGEQNPRSNFVDERALAIVIPLAPGAAPTVGFTIVMLDREYIVRELLPALTRRYFFQPSAPRSLEYRLIVVRRRVPHTAIYDSHAQEGGSVPAKVDAIAPLLGMRRPANVNGATDDADDEIRFWRTADASMSMPFREAHAVSRSDDAEFWELRVTHRAGSLEALVARTRRHNLIVSSAILVLLAGSLMLMLVALRRARALADQQMEFVAGISHELRTPVAALRMMGANLTDGVVRDANRVLQYGRVIQHEARRLEEMTEQVLSLARIENASRPDLERVAVDQLIQRAVQSLQPQIEELGFVCTISLDAPLPHVRVDKASLERAIQNLITNALKYSADRREIRITAGVEARRSHGEVWIAVEDRGIGIDADELSCIFEPFRRGRAAIERNIPGTGLGLSLVRRIVQACGGSVHVHSEPGVGSTFILRLPAAA